MDAVFRSTIGCDVFVTSGKAHSYAERHPSAITDRQFILTGTHRSTASDTPEASFSSGGGGRVWIAEGTCVILDADGSSTLASREDNLTLGREMSSRALRIMIDHAWSSQGSFFLHAAAYRVFDSGILVLAPQAAGKSILSAAALAAGGALVSDDWLALEIGRASCRERV